MKLFWPGQGAKMRFDSGGGRKIDGILVLVYGGSLFNAPAVAFNRPPGLFQETRRSARGRRITKERY